MADEDQQYATDVAAVKKWWTDSRWRYTKRPYTAEDIVAKRGNLKIEYPSNVLSKKLWKIMESRYAVCQSRDLEVLSNTPVESRCKLYLRLYGANSIDTNVQIS